MILILLGWFFATQEFEEFFAAHIFISFSQLKPSYLQLSCYATTTWPTY
jgi:hypothetical protein